LPKFHECGKFRVELSLQKAFAENAVSGLTEEGCIGYLGREFSFVGMNPWCLEANKRALQDGKVPQFLEFDSHFESGNLDLVI
jgi:hypothetical protein